MALLSVHKTRGYLLSRHPAQLLGLDFLLAHYEPPAFKSGDRVRQRDNVAHEKGEFDTWGGGGGGGHSYAPSVPVVLLAA